MQLKIKTVVVYALLFCCSSLFAQFNTLTHTSAKAKEIFPSPNELSKERSNNDKIDKNTGIIKKLFQNNNKKELKREINSLKAMLPKFGLSKNEEKKLDFKMIEDSLIQMIKLKVKSSGDVYSEKPIKKFAFIGEGESAEEYTSKIGMPLKNRMIVTSPFGLRTHPIFKTSRMHNGVDLKANYEQVHSVMDGYVTQAGWDAGGGGNFIKIKHAGKFETAYLHLSEIYYKTGEFVRAGSVIAKSGSSGNSTGAHLHFSVTENGKFINPIRFLNDLIKANNLIATYYEN